MVLFKNSLSVHIHAIGLINSFFQHPNFIHTLAGDKVEILDQRVSVCRDHANGACRRQQCKYYHIPVAIPPANMMATVHTTNTTTMTNNNNYNNNNNNNLNHNFTGCLNSTATNNSTTNVTHTTTAATSLMHSASPLAAASGYPGGTIITVVAPHDHQLHSI